MKISKPVYYDSFRCIAGACPDSCCKEWDVQVDEASAAFYRSLAGRLGDDLRCGLVEADGQTVMEIRDGRCPMWRQDGLCRIQYELGEQALCRTCREFPRLRHDYGSFQEWGLELSCPEAARLILENPDPVYTTEELPGGEEGDYDRQDMQVLLRTRQRMEQLLRRDGDFGEVLAMALLYGAQAQGELDGEVEEEFCEEAALRTACELAQDGSGEEILRFLGELDILTEAWRNRLAAPKPSGWSNTHRALAMYLVRRYYLQAVSDFDLMGRVKLLAVLCLTLKLVGEDCVQLLSKEIENSIDNLDALMDACYSHPAFTDRRLLGLLLHKD